MHLIAEDGTPESLDVWADSLDQAEQLAAADVEFVWPDRGWLVSHIEQECDMPEAGEAAAARDVLDYLDQAAGELAELAGLESACALVAEARARVTAWLAEAD